MKANRIYAILLVLALSFPLMAEEGTAEATAPAAAVVKADDLLLSDIPITYGDASFRSRILARTEGKRSPIGLVLSGGSARAMAHIGVLRYLEEQDIVPDFIISNSMGSIVGLLYSAGMSPDQIEKVVTNLDIGSSVGFTLPLQGGLLKADSLASLAVSILGGNRKIEDLSIPIMIVQEDLVTKRQVLVCEGDFATILRASFAIPVYFPSVEYQGHLLIDGGISSLAPIDLAYQYSDDVIVSTTFSSREDLNLRDPLTSLNTMVEIPKRRNAVEEIKRHPDMVWIRCQVEQNSFMDFDESVAIAKKGYEAAQSQKDALSALPKGMGAESMQTMRNDYSSAIDTALDHYFLYDHVRQTDYNDLFGADFNSYAADDLSYLKELHTFGMNYQGQWGNFTFSALGGFNYASSANQAFSISPSIQARFAYYAFHYLKLSMLMDIDWDTAQAAPGIYLRQNAEFLIRLFDKHLQLRVVEGMEHLTAHNPKRAFVGNTLLFNTEVEAVYHDKNLANRWSLSGSRFALGYQMLSDYQTNRHFLQMKADVILDNMPADLFFHLENTFRFSLDGKGDVPFFFQDGFRTNSLTLRSQGHDLSVSTSDANYLCSSRILFGYRPSYFKPSFGEVVILNHSSISVYADFLFSGKFSYSIGGQIDSTLSFLGMKDFPFTIYCGYDSASAGVIWGFFLSTVIS